jgi:hypothetical protein
LVGTCGGQGEWFGLRTFFNRQRVFVPEHCEWRAVVALAQLTVIVCDPYPRLHLDSFFEY